VECAREAALYYKCFIVYAPVFPSGTFFVLEYLPMKIAVFASEVAPFSKTGGLADVTGALPRFLTEQGFEVKVFTPLYREVRQKGFPLLKTVDRLTFDWAGQIETFSLYETAGGETSTYFIDKPALFDRECVYGTPSGGEYPDNGTRFGFFSKASLEALKALAFAPDVLHVHDWQASLALAYLKFVYADDPFFKSVKSLLTIHNLGYQGLFDPLILPEVGLPQKLYNMEDLEFYGKVNFLKAGILYASALNTVSYRYSLEIQTPEFGCGLDSLLRRRSDVLTGILNGIDYAIWNPANDSNLAAPYTSHDLAGKAACKADLLKAFGLPLSKKDIPLIGMVSRLAGQKGLDLLEESLARLFTLGLQLVILGMGEEKIQRALETARARYPSFFGLTIAFDDALAHKVTAGSDMFLIPSRYEPCGLTQMSALKYGTIPVVRATGGLDDSIREFNPEDGQGNGFRFEEYSKEALSSAVRKALRTYGQKTLRAKLVQNAMACDFSWNRSAQEYALLYKSIV